MMIVPGETMRTMSRFARVRIRRWVGMERSLGDGGVEVSPTSVEEPCSGLVERDSQVEGSTADSLVDARASAPWVGV
jgi:hypothetical protein